MSRDPKPRVHLAGVWNGVVKHVPWHEYLGVKKT